MELSKYFSGRINRRNFIYGAITLSLISAIAARIEPRTTMGLFDLLGGVFTFFFGFSIAVRRLHDVNQSGWWSLISLIPLINFLLLLYLVFAEGTPKKNRFGAKPKQSVRYPHDIFLLK